jgi:hypothetical protein
VAAAETLARDAVAAQREAADAAAELKAQANPGTPAAWEASYKVNTHTWDKSAGTLEERRELEIR